MPVCFAGGAAGAGPAIETAVTASAGAFPISFLFLCHNMEEYAKVGYVVGLSGRIFMLFGSGTGQHEYLAVQDGHIRSPEPSILLLDSGPFEERAVEMLRAAGFQVFTYDGSPYAENYRHARDACGTFQEVEDIALLPPEYLDENEEANDDVQVVYRIHFEPEPAAEPLAGKSAATF